MGVRYEDLYIHVPFCDGKCAYCSFYSEPAVDLAKAALWLNRLDGDLRNREFHLGNLKTLYIGGGTPTALPHQLLAKLFDTLRSRLSFALDPEISIECNPGSLDKAKAQLLASFVNRVSVGVQSFDDELLNVIGRRRPKSFNEIERTVEELRAAGIRNIGVDLIYGIPGQTIDAWRRDLELALLLRPEHISAYSLSVEEGTRLAQNGARPVDDDLAADMWDLAGEVLAGAGLPRYEVSNYAALPHECRHNQDVWHGRRYLGLGPSASSFDGVRRWTELAPIEKWLSEDSPAYDDLPPDSRAREIFVMGLRTASGWSQEDFRKVSDFQLDSLRPKLEDLSKDGLLTLDKGKIAPTRKGLAFWNSIAEELL